MLPGCGDYAHRAQFSLTAGLRVSLSHVFILLSMFIVFGARPARGQVGGPSIVDSVHNLSAGGPGTVKAAGENQVCIFCHTPHNATPVQPLWNRAMPVSSYKVYTSNSLKAQPGQPTGTSKLCLSCHDGTIALGSVNSRQQPIMMAGGITTIPPGASNLGTDLSDDHPISFVYNAALVTKNPKLKDPWTLPGNVRLDGGKELQCTTCHDAHNNQYGNFLVMSNQNSELCNTCHAMGPKGNITDITAHNPCASCHKTHTAPSGPYLLAAEKVSDTCLACHDGSVGPNKGVNIAALARGANPHDTKSAVNLADHIPLNVDCKDCHEPHTMLSGGTTPITPATPTAMAIGSRLGVIDGITIGGAAMAKAQYEYEVCFKCHGDKSAVNPRIGRALSQTNVRLQFATNAVSFHPVAAKGVNLDVPSLRPEYTTDSIIGCTDCHGSDASKKAGGVGPNGPHGSAYQGILLARYETADRTDYSTTAYALCFRCHDNTKVVADSGPFPLHATHVKSNQTPCSVCHDSHGIAFGQGNAMQNFALINFDTSVVLPDDVDHVIQFNHTGSEHGTCTLKCHGKEHHNTGYPIGP
jgi:predicted CXXCH cytochrome family protein